MCPWRQWTIFSISTFKIKMWCNNKNIIFLSLHQWKGWQKLSSPWFLHLLPNLSRDPQEHVPGPKPENSPTQGNLDGPWVMQSPFQGYNRTLPSSSVLHPSPSRLSKGESERGGSPGPHWREGQWKGRKRERKRFKIDACSPTNPAEKALLTSLYFPLKLPSLCQVLSHSLVVCEWGLL